MANEGPTRRSTRGRWFAAATFAGLIVPALGVSACGDSGSDDDGGPGAHEGKRVAIVQNQSDGYNIQVACGVTEEGERLGFEVEEPQGPKQFDPAEQAQVTNGVLARNPDALVYLPADAKAALQPVKPAVAQGLKLVTVDAELADPEVATSYVASDHVAGGEQMAEEVVRQLDGEGKVLVESVVPGHPIAQPRVDGFESVIEKSSGIEYAGARYPEPDIATIAADTVAAVRKDPDITAIYTTNNISTPGVVTGLREEGLAGKVKVFTWDFDDVGQKYLESGEVSALITQHPREMGQVAVQQLANAFDGEPVKAEVHPPVTLVTQGNMSEPDIQDLYYGSEC